MGDESGIARRFWNKSKKECLVAIYTPFVLSLASGDLDPQSFTHYISQDLHFLNAFAHAYQLAAQCADDDDDRSSILGLRRACLDEVKNREVVSREWGFEILKENTADNATTKYIEFLLATAAGKIEGEKFFVKIATPFEKTKLAAYTLGVIAPRVRLCAFICAEIQTLLDSDESNYIYKKWVDSYSSQKFEASVVHTEDMLDKLSISLTGEELEVIERLYHKSIKLQVDLFSAQPTVQPTVAPLPWVCDPTEHDITIFCDFDLACTVLDSSALLAEFAIITAPKTDQCEFETPLARLSSSELRNTWDLLSRQYAEEYEQCMKTILPSNSAADFDYNGLTKAVELISNFEKRANSRVVESGVLKGLNLEDIKRAGQGLILQDGCRGFFEKFVKYANPNANVHVLTYCWCGDLIRSAFSSGGLDVLKVHSNELIYDEQSMISTGEIDVKMESPIEKLETFNKIAGSNNSNNEMNMTIYIGGSVGDILCLLEADIGIVIDSSPSLRKVAEQFGVSIVPLFPGLVKKQRELGRTGTPNWKGLSGVLYTVSGWAEIRAFVLGT